MRAWFADFWKRATKWYEGTYTPYDNPPNSDVFIFGLNHKLHWTARVTRSLIKFYLTHWQWLWGTLIALVGLLVALLALK